MVGFDAEAEGSATFVTSEIVDQDIRKAIIGIEVQEWLLIDDGAVGADRRTVKNFGSNRRLKPGNDAAQLSGTVNLFIAFEAVTRGAHSSR